MAQEHIDFTTPGGDTVTQALHKAEDNFNDLYALINKINPVGGLKNYIINPSFRFWQDGPQVTVPDSTAVYVCDQWIIQKAALTGFAYGQGAYPSNDANVPKFGSPNYLSVGNTGNTDAAAHLLVVSQRLESVAKFAGKQYTLRMDLFSTGSRNVSMEFYQGFGAGGSPPVSGILPSVPVQTLQPGWNTLYWTVNIPAIAPGTVIGAGNNLQMILWLSGGSNFNARTGNLGAQNGTVLVGYAQLEDGAVSTPIQIRPEGLELILCQRYFEKSYSVDLALGTTGSAAQSASSGMTICAAIQAGANIMVANFGFRVQKRVAPTMTLYDPVQADNQAWVQSAGACTSSLLTGGENNFAFQTTTHANTAVGRAIWFHWAANARL